MTASPDRTTAPAPSAEDQLKQKLIGRIAVAGIVIVLLLGGLALFDALMTPQAPPPAKIAMAPPLPGAAADAGAPGAAATEPAADRAEPAKTDEPAKPDEDNKPQAEDTRAAAGDALPPLPAAAKDRPATAKPAALHPGMAPALPTVVDTPAEGTAAPATTPPPAAKPAAAKPAATKSANRPPVRNPMASRPSAPYGESPGWALQVGLFSNPDNAEEVRQKLEAAGIPAIVETRVRAGPFASRAEADAAHAKLRALGLGESLLVSVKK